MADLRLATGTCVFSLRVTVSDGEEECYLMKAF